MKLTREQAIDYSIELWEWIVGTEATSKRGWPKWKKYGDNIECDCFLCEYVLPLHALRCRDCKLCPYYQKFHGKCYGRNTLYDKWAEAETIEDVGKYARKFLAKLKKLKEDL